MILYYFLEYQSSNDPRKDIFNYAVEKSWILTEMSVTEKNLEDIFRNLTGKKDGDNNSSSTSFYKPRHYIPMLFAIYLIALINIFFFSQYELMKLISSIPLLIYAFLALVFGLKNAFERKNALYSISIPAILATLHLSYGFGSIYGIFQLFFPKLKSIRRK